MRNEEEGKGRKRGQEGKGKEGKKTREGRKEEGGKERREGRETSLLGPSSENRRSATIQYPHISNAGTFDLDPFMLRRLKLDDLLLGPIIIIFPAYNV